MLTIENLDRELVRMEIILQLFLFGIEKRFLTWYALSQYLILMHNLLMLVNLLYSF